VLHYELREISNRKAPIFGAFFFVRNIQLSGDIMEDVSKHAQILVAAMEIREIQIRHELSPGFPYLHAGDVKLGFENRAEAEQYVEALHYLTRHGYFVAMTPYEHGQRYLLTEEALSRLQQV
jgi:hypothetical protein